MNKKLILTIVILAGIIVTVAGVAWYLSLIVEIPPELVPSGSFSVAEVDNGRVINLTFESDTGIANYEDCRILVINPQGTQYNWDLIRITWANNEAKNSSVIPGIDLKIIRSNGQTAFSTGNLVELEKQEGMLANGNWVITLNYKLTGGLMATRTVAV
jgi:hypothetical protein